MVSEAHPKTVGHLKTNAGHHYLTIYSLVGGSHLATVGHRETAMGRPDVAFYRQRCGEYPRPPWCEKRLGTQFNHTLAAQKQPFKLS